MERTQFTFYESFFRAISRIKDNGDRAATYDAICAYALYGTIPDLDSLPDSSAIAFELIKPNLDASRKKAANGKLGGRPKANQKQTESKPKANNNQPEREGEKEEENEIEVEKEEENEIEVEDECLLGNPAPDVNAAVGAVVSDYLNRINPAASPLCLEELSSYAEELGVDVCKRAFDVALDAKKTSWSYIKAILRDKQQNGVKCLADWIALEESREKAKSATSTKGGGRKEMVPAWMTEEGKSEMAKYMQDLKKRKTAGTDPELAARAEELRRKFTDKGEESH